MKALYTLLILLIPFVGFGQSTSEAMEKLKNMKELLEMDLISKSEFDSISSGLKEIILNNKNENVQNSDISDGFYYKNNIMYPEKFSESKTDYLGYALTYGLAGGSTKSILNGLISRVKVDSVQEFKLYISENVDLAGNNRSNIQNQQFFSSAQSPQDFALVKLTVDENKETRWIKTGSMSLADGFSFSIKSKEYIDFKWENSNKNGEFIINTELESGEYAFVFVGTSSYSNNSIYTFSVENEIKSKNNSNTSIKKPRRFDFKSQQEYLKALKEYNKINQK
mgnify:FL=1|tara:strand:+ start:204 stop:1046 length:843 start_codon:yes stop_codon:yes gene_type:complete